MTKDWYNIICLADDLGLEFEYSESKLTHIKFFKKDKELAIIQKRNNQWLLFSTQRKYASMAKTPQRLVNLVASMAKQ
jgi:hypothetical protein